MVLPHCRTEPERSAAQVRKRKQLTCGGNLIRQEEGEDAGERERKFVIVIGISVRSRPVSRSLASSQGDLRGLLMGHSSLFFFDFPACVHRS
jgi:hypothetical protein